MGEWLGVWSYPLHHSDNRLGLNTYVYSDCLNGSREKKNLPKSIAGPRTARVVVGFPPSASLLDLVVGAGVPKPLGTSRGVPIEMFMVPFLPVALIQRAFHRPQLALPFALETCSDSEYRIIGLSVCGSISSRNNRRTTVGSGHLLFHGGLASWPSWT